jgi:hypothetical protein
MFYIVLIYLLNWATLRSSVYLDPIQGILNEIPLKFSLADALVKYNGAIGDFPI